MNWFEKIVYTLFIGGAIFIVIMGITDIIKRRRK